MQEKTGPLRGLGVWKMPTGLIDEVHSVHCVSFEKERAMLESYGNVCASECSSFGEAAHKLMRSTPYIP